MYYIVYRNPYYIVCENEMANGSGFWIKMKK